MRSRLLVFLLVLMPLQLCWAAVAGYCNAGGAGSSPLVALHCCEHGLLPSDARVAEPMPGQAADQGFARIGDAATDADCGTCHSQGADALQAQRIPMPSVGPERFDIGTAPLSSPAPASRPERPQWRALV